MKQMTNQKPYKSPSSLSFVLIAFLSSTAMATPMYLEGIVGAGINKEDKTLTNYGRFGAGALIHDNLIIGAATSFMEERDRKLNSYGYEFFVRPRMALGDNYFLYGDLGYRTSGDNLLSGLGIQYQLSPSWSFDAGYRWHKAPITDVKNDFYQVNLGIQYYFRQKMQGYNTPPVYQSQAVEEPIVQNATTQEHCLSTARANNDHDDVSTCRVTETPTSEIEKRCEYIFTKKDLPKVREHLQQYIVIRDTWLTRIAREHCITLDVLMALNPHMSPEVRNIDLIFPGDKLSLPETSLNTTTQR